MFSQKLPIKLLRLRSLILLLLLILSSNPQNTLSQTQPNSQTSDRNSVQFQQPSFPDNGAPKGRRRGGTSRGGYRGGTSSDSCPPLDSSLTALVPGEEANGITPFSTSFLATTIAERPTIWVNLPQLPQDNRYGEFVFQDETGNDIYRISMTLSETGGVLGISLPPSIPALEIGKKYHWYFQLFCGSPKTQPEYLFVDAWIQRVASSPQLKTQLQAQQTQKYLIYVKHNLWYDALTNLANHRINNFNNEQFQDDWLKILSSVNLSDLASKPILGLHK